ncbi:MAG: hypothetical protein ACFCGT_17135 [Sandaracinaceae bacterium]
MGRWAALVPAFAVLAACGPAGSGTASLELGTGTFRFQELQDGDQVDLVRGAQGGWHVWLSLRTLGLPGQEASLLIGMERADGTRPPDETQVDIRLGLPNDDGERLMLGWPAIVAEPGCYVGRLVRLSVRLAADNGAVLTDERDLRYGAGADPPPPCE